MSWAYSLAPGVVNRSRAHGTHPDWEQHGKVSALGECQVRETLRPPGQCRNANDQGWGGAAPLPSRPQQAVCRHPPAGRSGGAVPGILLPGDLHAGTRPSSLPDPAGREPGAGVRQVRGGQARPGRCALSQPPSYAAQPGRPARPPRPPPPLSPRCPRARPRPAGREEAERRRAEHLGRAPRRARRFRSCALPALPPPGAAAAAPAGDSAARVAAVRAADAARAAGGTGGSPAPGTDG